MIDYKFEKWAADAFDAKVENLTKPNRLNDDTTYARYICYLYLTKTTSLIQKKIASRYGKNGASSSIASALRRVRELIEINDPKFMMGLAHFNDMVEEHNIIKGDNIKTLDKSWTFTDKDISSMQFMKENEISSYKIATHYNITISDLRHILNKNK